MMDVLPPAAASVADFQLTPPLLHVSELCHFPGVGNLKFLFTQASPEPACAPLAHMTIPSHGASTDCSNQTIGMKNRLPGN